MRFLRHLPKFCSFSFLSYLIIQAVYCSQKMPICHFCICIKHKSVGFNHAAYLWNCDCPFLFHCFGRNTGDIEKKHEMLCFVKLQISILNFIHIPFQNDKLSPHSSEVKIFLNSFASSILLFFPFD